MARKALSSLLSQKARDNEIVMLDEFRFPALKTKEGAALCARFQRADIMTSTAKRRILVAIPNGEEIMTRVFRNIPYAAAVASRNLNILDVARYTYLLFSQKSLENFLTHRHGLV
jgi:large subunit ribosomal protein L4